MEVRAGYKQTEVGTIPEDWQVTTLAKVSRMKSGESITAANIDLFSEYPCYGGNGLRGFTSRFTHDGKYALIGRQGALCGNVLGVSGKFFASEHAVVVTPFEQTDIQWLTYVLENMNLNQYSESSAQPGLSVAKILNLALAVPPTKAEQEAIAEALSDADALIEGLEQVIAKKRQVKQGAMSELLSGKRRLSGYSDEWKIVPFESLCRTFTKQTGFDYSASIKPSLIMEHREGFLPFIQNKDFEGKNINYQTDYFVPEKIAVKFPRILLDEKCLLISISGSIGNVAIFSNLQTAFVGGAIAVGKFFNQKHLDWVLYYLQSYEGQNKFFGNVKAGSHHNLTLEDIRKVEIPMPSEEEQTAIAEILSDMDAEITALEEKLSKARQVKAGMMQELLTGRIRLVDDSG